jgi:hypothetical protein
MKNFREILRIALLFALVIVINSCKKEGLQGPQGVQGETGPLLTGNLKGHISCSDQYGNTVLINLAGMKDSLNGTSKVALTDSTGFYTFAGLTTGNYSFTITASGYGMTKVQNFQFVGGGDTYHDVKISQIPDFNVLTCTDSIAGTNVIVKGTLPADPKVRTVVVFVAGVSNVSSLPQYYLDYFSKNTTLVNPNNFAISIPQSDFINLGIASGSTAYFAVYGAAVNFSSSSAYEDMSTGRIVFTALSSTPAYTSIVVP